MPPSSAAGTAATRGAPDRRSLRVWLAIYAAWLAGLALPLWLTARARGLLLRGLLPHPDQLTAAGDQAVKLLVFALYVSLATTFVPLPTGPIVSALATRQAALSPSLGVTVLLVASVGAVCSVMANLQDYHLFTWLLRSRRVAAIRSARLYQRAERWFQRRPFGLLVLFNILPVPVDVVRVLAASAQYPLRPFALANFLGRFVRYAVIAAVTFLAGPKGWLVALALLGVALAGVLWRAARRMTKSEARMTNE